MPASMAAISSASVHDVVIMHLRLPVLSLKYLWQRAVYSPLPHVFPLLMQSSTYSVSRPVWQGLLKGIVSCSIS